MPEENLKKGALFIIISAFLVSVSSVCVRLSGDISAFQKSFFRNLIIAVIYLCMAIARKQKLSCQKKSILPLTARCIFGYSAVLLQTYCFSSMNLSDATMLLKLSPLTIAIVSWIVLKEKVFLKDWISYLVMIGGAVFIIKPSMNLDQMLGPLAALASDVAVGISYSMLRVLGKNGENSIFVVLVFAVSSLFIASPFVIFNFQSMSLIQLLFLFGSGISAGLAQTCIQIAYTNAPGKKVSIFDFSNLLFTAIISYILFRELPDYLSLIGYVIIISVVVIMYLNNTGHLVFHHIHVHAPALEKDWLNWSKHNHKEPHT